MIIFLYPGVDIGLDKENLPENFKVFHRWDSDINIHNGTYVRAAHFCSAILTASKAGYTVLADCQPKVRYFTNKQKDKEKTAIIFPSLEIKNEYTKKLLRDILDIYPDDNNKKEILNYLAAAYHVMDEFDYDIRAIMYEAGYNRNWYNYAYALKDTDYDLLDIINKFREG